MSILSKKEQKVLDSHREILWLKRQIEHYEKEDQFEVQEIPEDVDEKSIKDGILTYRKHINEMKIQLDLATLRNKKREEIAKAIDEHYFTLKAIYPERAGHSEMEIKRITEQHVNNRDKLVSEFMHVLEELNEKKLELTKVQGDIIKQHLANRQVMQRVDDLQQGVENMDIQENTTVLHQQ